MRYPLVISKEDGGYAATVPDLPGCTALGETLDAVILNAEASMQAWADRQELRELAVPGPSRMEDIEVPEGRLLASALLVRIDTERPSVRVNLVLDARVAETIDREAQRRRMSRKDYIEWMLRFVGQAGA